jgi:hypothetical protein
MTISQPELLDNAADIVPAAIRACEINADHTISNVISFTREALSSESYEMIQIEKSLS